jgi:hypothetical protein
MTMARMDEGFECEALGSLVIARLTGMVSERALEECQHCVLGTMQETGSKAVLYDLTEMEPAPVKVLLFQRVLNEHVAHLGIKRAIVVPNTSIAHLVRFAFGGSDYRLFYDDIDAAKRFLRDESPFSDADWSVRVIDERRLRQRRSSLRGSAGRRQHDRAIGGG